MTKNIITAKSVKITSIGKRTAVGTVSVHILTPGERPIFMQFSCKGQAATDVLKFAKGDRVDMTGYCRGYYTNSRQGKTKKKQFFICDSIKPSKTIAETEFGGGSGLYYEKAEIRYLISGEILTINVEGQFINMSVRVDDDKSERDTSVIRMSYMCKNLDEKPQKGQRISAVCQIKTPEPKIIDGKKTFYENIIVSDLVVTD